MATHSNTLAWKIPWTEEPGRSQSVGSQRVRHDRATKLSLSMTAEHSDHQEEGDRVGGGPGLFHRGFPDSVFEQAGSLTSARQMLA